jgi:hypothetical protein
MDTIISTPTERAKIEKAILTREERAIKAGDRIIVTRKGGHFYSEGLQG